MLGAGKREGQVATAEWEGKVRMVPGDLDGGQ